MLAAVDDKDRTAVGMDKERDARHTVRISVDRIMIAAFRLFFFQVTTRSPPFAPIETEGNVFSSQVNPPFEHNNINTIKKDRRSPSSQLFAYYLLFLPSSQKTRKTMRDASESCSRFCRHRS